MWIVRPRFRVCPSLNNPNNDKCTLSGRWYKTSVAAAIRSTCPCMSGSQVAGGPKTTTVEEACNATRVGYGLFSRL